MIRRLLARTLVVLIVVAIVLGTYIGIRANRYLNHPIDAQGGRRTFTIAAGQSFRSIVDGLHADGIVTDRLVFEGFARIRRVSDRIEAGRYTIDMSETPKSLLLRLSKGTKAMDVRVTLTEGMNKWQVADRLSNAGLVDRDAFLARVDRDNLEGRLFPDTYRFPKQAGVAVVIARLNARFEAVFGEVVRGHADTVELSKEGALRTRIVTLASMIEREAQTDRDRHLVSRVFRNRLAKKMKLQTDPTCVYRADLYKKRAHPRYCKDPKSRYSTYVIPGLPPTPIANPGRAALKAALHPSTRPGAEKLFYFVARRDGSGEHAFNETYAEHRADVERYLKKGKR